MYNNYKELVEKATKPLISYMEKMEKHMGLIRLNPQEYIEKIKNDEKMKSLEAVRREITRIRTEKSNVTEILPQWVNVSCFRISLEDIVKFLMSKFDDIDERETAGGDR